MAHNEKSKLRLHAKAILSKLTVGERQTASESICQHIAQSGLFTTEVRTMAIFAANGPEVSLETIHSLLPKMSLTYPLCREQNQLSFHSVSDPQELRPGMLGIPEPVPELHPEIPLEQIDLFLCPGLMFGQDGSRLGYGGGYYDRVLAATKALVVGVGFSQQILSSVPVADHDVSMQYLVTETGIKPTTQP